jgi:hypothetical protein
MSLFLLAIYTGLLIIRPQDWWEPILGWELVNITAIATLIASVPTILEKVPVLWRSVPEIKFGAAFVIGFTLSLLPKFWPAGMQVLFQEYGKIYILFFLLILLGSTPPGYRAILWTILGCSIFMAIHACLQIHTGAGFGGSEPLLRVVNSEEGTVVQQAMAFGTFSDPNDLCLIFVLSIPLFWGEYRTSSSVFLRTLSFLAIPLVGYGAWLTNSRGGYLAISAMVISHLISGMKGFRRWVLIAFSVFLLTVFAPSRFAAGFIGQQDRSILWGDGIAMFKANPFFGVGVGMFTDYSSDHKVAHNTYVQVLAEAGIIGYMPFFLLIFFCVVHLRRAITLSPHLSKSDQIQLNSLFAASVGILVSLYFLTRSNVHLPYIMLALMTCKSLSIATTRETYNRIFSHGFKDYRNAVMFGLASIAFMWGTIRIVNALG